LFQRVGLLRGWLYNKPLIDYLEGGEIVDYLFVSSKPVTEFTAGQKTELVPKKGYSSIVAITDDRILLLIARKPTNDKREIQYRDIENFKIEPISNLSIDTNRGGTPSEPSTRLRFEIETPHRTIHWYSGPTQSIKISEVTERLGPTLQKRTAGSGWTNRDHWIEAVKEYREKLDEYERWQSEVSNRVSRAEDISVTQSRLENIWERLNPNEQPHYYTTGKRHEHKITRSREQSPVEVSNHSWTIFSDHRILIQNSSTSYEIEYSDILEFSVNERSREVDETTDNVNQLDIQTPNEYHILDITSLSQSQISNLVAFIDDSLGG
jgi:hypothetical protein